MKARPCSSIRAIILVVFMLASILPTVANAQACSWRETGPDYVRWINNGKAREVRLIKRVDQWDWILAMEGMYFADCSKCQDEIRSATFWVFNRDSEDTRLEDLLNPKAIAEFVARVPPSIVPPLGLTAKSPLAELSVFGIPGKAVLVEPDDPKYSVKIVAFAAVKECIVIFGYLGTTNDRPLNLQHAQPFTSSINAEFHDWQR